MNYYDEIYEELCYRVEEGELSLEDAELINEVAYDRYVEESFFKKMKEKSDYTKKIKNSAKNAKNNGYGSAFKSLYYGNPTISRKNTKDSPNETIKK